MNTNERPDLSKTPASARRRPLPSVPRNVPTAANSSSSPSLSNTSSTSPDSEVLPKYPSLPPDYSSLPGLLDEKKIQHADTLSNAPIHSASSTTSSFATSTSASTAPSSPPAARSWPASPARVPMTPPRSVPASPSLVPPALTALAIPPSPAPRGASGESLSALWSAEVQPSAVEPQRQSFTQALRCVDPIQSARTPVVAASTERPIKSATPTASRSDTSRKDADISSVLRAPRRDGHIKTARRSASAHHLKQRSNAEMYNFPRADNSFLTLVSPDSAVSVERPRTPSLKEDMERITRKRERSRPRAENIDVARWVQQTAAQSTRLVGEPATPHPARSTPAVPPVPRNPSQSRERTVSGSARGRSSAHGPSAFRPPQTPLPATPATHRAASSAERPHTSHQRAHTLADVPRQRFRSEPDLLALTKPKHTRSTSERLISSTERPPLPTSPPLRRDSLVSLIPPRSTTPKLFRSLTSRAKQAFSSRSRVNSNTDVPPTPPLPPHAIPVS